MNLLDLLQIVFAALLGTVFFIGVFVVTMAHLHDLAERRRHNIQSFRTSDNTLVEFVPHPYASER